ncbi:hypothetical protein [Pontibacter russatus]
MNRHQGLQWASVLAKPEADPERLWSLDKWKEPVANRVLNATIKRPANASFMIARRKVPEAAEVLAITGRPWNQGNNKNRKIARLVWLRQLELNC